MTLRDYQLKAVEETLESLKLMQCVLGMLPTGMGKTIVFAEIIRRILEMNPGKKAMVVAHRRELIYQAKDKIEKTTGLICEVEMGDEKAEDFSLFGKTDVIVTSVQTQASGGDGGGRMTKFNPEEFACIIYDECHHCISPSYEKTINYYKYNPNVKIIGVTATPDRSDEKAMGRVFGEVAFEYELLQAIQDGWLVPIDQRFVTIGGMDFSEIRTTAGDLNGGDLAAVLENEKTIHPTVSATLDIIGEKRAIGFCASVAQAQQACEIFNRYKPGKAAFVFDGTDKEERKQMLIDFADGKYQIIYNCGILTEGFDDCGVEVVIPKPTKSRSLFCQMIGRGTRPLPGIVDGPATPELRCEAIANSAKKSVLVLDFCGNSGKHKLINCADLLGGKYEDDIVERAAKRVRESGKSKRMDLALAEEEELKRQERMELIRQQEEAERKRRERLRIKTRYTAVSINPFDTFCITANRVKSYNEGRMLTPKQLAVLQKQGIDTDGMPYDHAKQLLNEIFHRWDAKLCSFKQAKTLQRFGYDTKSMTMPEASSLIDAIAKNGWKVPSNVKPAEPVAV